MGIYLYDWNYKELKSVFDRADESQIGWFTEIKEPHGELIDRITTIRSLLDYHTGMKSIGQCIDDVPTVIEAEVDADLEYQMASDMQDYCERYEPTYDPENGSMQQRWSDG